MSSFLVIFCCLSAGLLLKRFSSLPENTALVLNQYVIYIALPALILAKVPLMELTVDAIWCMAVAWIALVFSALIVLSLAKMFNWSRSTRCVLLLLVPLGNTSFVGIPLVDALLGSDAVGYAVLYDQLGSFLALSSYGAVILALHSTDKKRPVTVLGVARKIIAFPPFIALAIALILNHLMVLSFESVLSSAMNVIGASLIPTVMVAVGFQWKFVLPKQDLAPFAFGLTIKLLIAPLFILFVLQWLNLPKLQSATLLLESAMAPMISAGALLISEKQNPDLTASMVGYGLLLGLMTVPIWSLLWL